MTVKGIPSCCELSDDDFSVFTMNIQSPLFFALEGTGMRWDECMYTKLQTAVV